MQGWRADHEDAHFMRDQLTDDGYAIFGVLDGHGGCEVARLAAHVRLPGSIQRAADGSQSVDDLETSVSAAFVETDAWLRERPEVTRDQSGSTCVVAGLKRSQNKVQYYEVFLANAGDSRGLVLRRAAGSKRGSSYFGGGSGSKEDMDVDPEVDDDRPLFPGLSSQTGGVAVLVASEDHKPDRRDEHARIAAAGGFVSDVDAAKRGGGVANVVARLDGNLAVSRGLGDFAYKRDSRRQPKEQKVSCVPELYHVGSLKDGMSVRTGDLVVLACDGIFDVMSNEDLAKAIGTALNADVPADLGDIAARILTACLHNLNSKDNMTLMIIEVGVDGSDYAYRPVPKKSRRPNVDHLTNYLLAPQQPGEAAPSRGQNGGVHNDDVPFGSQSDGSVARTVRYYEDDDDVVLDDDLDDLDDDDDDDDDGKTVDEIVGIDQYDKQCDEAVKRSYIAFLEYCESDEHSKLPREARDLLKRVARSEARNNGRPNFRRHDDADDDDNLTLGLGIGGLDPARN